MGAERKQKIKEMRAICIPESRNEYIPAADKRIFIPLGFLFTRLLVRTRMTPNQITVMWGMMMVFFSLLYILNCPLLNVVAAIGWIISFALDNTDGQIARYKGLRSKRGIFLDTVNHSVTFPLLFFCIGLGQYFTSGEILDVIMGSAAGLFMLLISIMKFVYIDANGEDPSKGGWSPEAERRLFKNENVYTKIRDISPLTFMNIFFVILAAAILDLIWALFDAAPGIELLWMTSFFSIITAFYAAGYLAGFLIRAVALYKKLN